MSTKEPKAPMEGTDDLFPPLGNLGDKTLAHLRAVLEKGDSQVMENYESLVEDFIETFSHAVIQGVPPEWAMFSMAQAFAITFGQCLRADFPAREGGKILRMIIENADLSAKMVKEVSLHS